MGPLQEKFRQGIKIIILSYARMSVEDARKFNPTLVFPNENNFLN